MPTEGAAVTTSPDSPNPLYQLADGQATPDNLVAVPAGTITVPDGCLIDTLGITLTHVARGASQARMRIEKVHLNQRGIAHGGAIVTLADAAAGWAAYATLPDGRFTTLELSCNLLGRVSPGDLLTATTSPVHLGRRTLVLDVAVRRAERLVARFSCTQLVLAAQ